MEPRRSRREGQGPGELAAPNSIAVSPDGTVSVFDFGKAALVRFDSMGGVLEQHPTSMYPVVLQPRHMLGTRDGTLFASLIDPVDENTFRYALRLVTPLDTVLIAALPSAQEVLAYARTYNSLEGRAGAAVLAVSILSIVTLTALIYLIGSRILPADLFP